jgi:hypothetical protein
VTLMSVSVIRPRSPPAPSSGRRPAAPGSRSGGAREQARLLRTIGAPRYRFLAIALPHDQQGVRFALQMDGHVRLPFSVD